MSNNTSDTLAARRPETMSPTTSAVGDVRARVFYSGMGLYSSSSGCLPSPECETHIWYKEENKKKYEQLLEALILAYELQLENQISHYSYQMIDQINEDKAELIWMQASAKFGQENERPINGACTSDSIRGTLLLTLPNGTVNLAEVERWTEVIPLPAMLALHWVATVPNKPDSVLIGFVDENQLLRLRFVVVAQYGVWSVIVFNWFREPVR